MIYDVSKLEPIIKEHCFRRPLLFCSPPPASLSSHDSSRPRARSDLPLTERLTSWEELIPLRALHRCCNKELQGSLALGDWKLR